MEKSNLKENKNNISFNKICSLFIIDESSMINNLLLTYITKYAISKNVKVIFLGDEKQINPVDEENSPVFHQGYPEVELKEIIRQKISNPIIKLSQNINSIKRIKNNIIENQGYIYTNNLNKVINNLAEVNGTNKLKYIAWTNKDINNVNYLVRKKIYTNPNKIELNETIIFNSPYNNEYYTNQEVKISNINIITSRFGYNINRLTKLKYTTDECYLKYYNANSGIRIIHEESEEKYNKIKKLLRSKALSKDIYWTDYYGFINQFADIKYNHAITVHKSQGSTYETAIVNLKNININPMIVEKNRLLYTAITRPSKLLILFNY